MLHNFATALSNLGANASELSESITLFERALEWRTSERAIARGVTLHNLGLALRRWAELEPERARERLEASAVALSEAVAIREAHGLAEGQALSRFHLGLTLERLAATGQAAAMLDAQRELERAAEEFERLGKQTSAAVARERSARKKPGRETGS